MVINYYNFLLTKDFLAHGYRTKSCHHYCIQTFLDHIHGIIIIIIIILYSPKWIKIPICNSDVIHTLTCLCSTWSNLCSTFCDAHKLSVLVAFLLYSKTRKLLVGPDITLLYLILHWHDLGPAGRLSYVLLHVKHWSVSGTSLANDQPTSAQVM